jgi:hypothetical protein
MAAGAITTPLPPSFGEALKQPETPAERNATR